MTNPIAVFLALAILLALGLDFVFNDSHAMLVWTRKFLEFIEWIAFWR